jgi:hypothetical protein
MKAGTTVMLIAILTATPSPCQAQRLSVGLRTGINASRMTFQDRAAQSIVKPTPGFHLGVLAGLKMRGILELETEILYTEKGFDSDDEKLDLAYIEVPLLFTLRWPVALSPRLFGGPIVSFEVSCKSSRVPGLGAVGCDSPLASAQRQKTDVGLALGAGVAWGAGAGSVFLDLWINQGLRDISQETRSPGWVRNQALLLSVGYRYPLGGGR